MPNCRLVHTFEKNIFITVKNWWSLTYGQVYICYLHKFVGQHKSRVNVRSVHLHDIFIYQGCDVLRVIFVSSFYDAQFLHFSLSCSGSFRFLAPKDYCIIQLILFRVLSFSCSQRRLHHLAYPVQGPFVFLLPKTITSFGFELYLLKGITETSRVHEI